MKKLIFAFAALLIGLTSNPMQAQWKQNYGPFGWSTQHFATGNGYVFAMASKISRSSDNGLTWEDKSNGIWQSGVTALIFSGTRVLAGIGNDGYLYISDDNGENWTQNNTLVNNKSITGFAKIGSKLFLITYNNGVFLSTDNGDSWTKCSGNGITNTAINCFASIGNYLFAGAYDGLYKSSDDGNNWVICNNTIANNDGNVEVRSLAVHNNNLFVGGISNSTSEVFKTSDNGTTFSSVASGPWLTWARNLYCDGTNIYVNMNEGIYRSNDDGASWVYLGLAGVSTWATTVSGGNLIVGSEMVGIFTSTNNGSSWINTGWSHETAVTTLASINNILVANCGYEGLFVSRNNGNSFTEYDVLSKQLLKCFAVRGNDIFAGSDEATGGSIYKSSDLGYTWKAIGIPDIDILAIAFKDSITFAGTYANGILRTTNDGAIWKQVSNGFSKLYCEALQVIGSQIYAGSDGGVYVSTNNGDSWSVTKLNSHFVNSLAVIDSKLFAGTDDGLYALESSGDWTQIAFGYKMVQCIKAIGSKLYAGTTTGLYVSNDLGLSWTLVNDGLPSVAIYDIAINGDNAFLGTSNGLFRRPFSEITGVDVKDTKVPDNYMLMQNYPNPFNPTTRIDFTLPERSNVSLNIYNQLGQKVAQLVNDEKAAGSYSVQWDASNMASGVYFYELTTNNFRSVKKLVLMK